MKKLMSFVCAALFAYFLIHRNQIVAASAGRKLERNRLLNELNHEYFAIMARRCVIKAGASPEESYDSAQMLDEGRDEMLARLLAVADDIDAGLPLIVQRQTQGVLFALDERVFRQFPRRPERFGLGKPAGFGQAAGGGGRQ